MGLPTQHATAGRGARPFDADEGVRQIGAAQKADTPTHHGGMMMRLIGAVLLAPLLALGQDIPTSR
jgi:hypothetical protein